MVQILVVSPRLKIQDEDFLPNRVAVHTAEDLPTFAKMLGMIVFNRVVVDLELFEIRTADDFITLQRKLSTLGTPIHYLMSSWHEKVTCEVPLSEHEAIVSRTITGKIIATSIIEIESVSN